jgi:UPF0755 protein
VKKLIQTLAVVVVLLAALVGGAGYYVWSELSSVGTESYRPDDTARVAVIVDKGMGPNAIARLLVEKGIIANETRFVRYLRFIAKKSSALKAGEYLLSPSMTGNAIIEELSTGRVAEQRFTVREGLRKEEIARIIADAGFGTVDEVLREMNSPARVRAFGVPAVGAGGQKEIPGGIEGYLFPDTYQFPKGTKPGVILDRMRARLDEIVDDKMRARMNEIGWDLHKVLTLAAIVEKETGQPFERPHIASVFTNRLKLKMKLQTDPTVIYGIKNYDGNIRKSDLLEPHAYNTYTIPGLPPGPIASPGREAIMAALYPDDAKDLFFVSRNDGTHIFCPTLDCHNAAVQQWQIEFFRKKKKGG